MLVTTLLASLVLAVLTPITAFGVTLGVARLNGRLMRWRDVATGRSQGFDIRVGPPLLEFTVGLLRGLAASLVAVGLFLMLGAAPVLLGVGTVIALLTGWNAWVFATHRRMSPAGGAAVLETVIKARWCGDVAGAALGGVLYVTLIG